MAIQIKNLKEISDQFTNKPYRYKDLHLDFNIQETFDVSTDSKQQKNDIHVDYDIAAIKNSIRNLFNTLPGQRFLFPLYGLDLYQFLFEPITDSNSRLIGETIVRAIEKYEPRVQLINCRVIANPDDNEYNITIIVEMPDLKTRVPITTTMDLKTQTFIFVETSRNK